MEFVRGLDIELKNHGHGDQDQEEVGHYVSYGDNAPTREVTFATNGAFKPEHLDRIAYENHGKHCRDGPARHSKDNENTGNSVSAVIFNNAKVLPCIPRSQPSAAPEKSFRGDVQGRRLDPRGQRL